MTNVETATILNATRALDRFAQERYGRHLVHLAVRWILDKQGSGFALWGGRRPEQLEPVDAVYGRKLDGDAMKEIDNILADNIQEPVGPECMAPPDKAAAGAIAYLDGG